ncbi:spermatogenesis-associated protein 4 [Sorochytrium milnesiophthora]
MRGVPRECLLWLRSLNLAVALTPHSLGSGTLLAAVLGHYFPRTFPSRTFGSGISLPARIDQWTRLQAFMSATLGVCPAPAAILAIIHGRRDLAIALLVECWEVLTGKSAPAECAAVVGRSPPRRISITAHQVTLERERERKASVGEELPCRPHYERPTVCTRLASVPTVALAMATDKRQLKVQLERVAAQSVT